MKKIFGFLFLLVCVFAFSACTKSYTVEFVSNDAIEYTVNVKDGEVVSEYEPTSYEDHSFSGWYNGDELFDFNTPITSNLTLTAKWDLIQYEIVFKDEDGTILQSSMVNINSQIEAPLSPTKASDSDYDYTFAGWDKTFDVAKENMTITATYTKSTRMYDVTFYDENNNEVTKTSIEKGKTATSINMKKDDDTLYSYKMAGWYLNDGTKFDFNKPITSNLNLYVKYTKTPVYFNTTDKKVSIIGDSVSTFYKSGDANSSYYQEKDQYYYPTYCSAISSSANTWWMITINNLNAKLGVNNSLSGSTVTGTSNTAGQNSARINTLGENGTPDIIITYLGINDNVNGISASDYEKAYRNMLTQIQSKYPNAYLFACTMSYSNYHKNMPDNHYYYSEETRLAYNEVIEKLVEEYQIGMIDFASAVTEENYSKNLNDNLHYNVTGMKTMAAQATLDITKYFNQGKALYGVNFVLDSDDITLSSELYSYYQDEVVTLPTASKEGYTFEGWYTDEEFESAKITTTKDCNSDLTLYPKFIPTLASGEYYIEYKLNGGRLVVVDIPSLEKEFCADYAPFARTFFSKDEIEINSIQDLGVKKYDDGSWNFIKDESGNTIWSKLYYAQSSGNNGYCILEFFKEYQTKWGWLLDYLAAIAINNASLMNTSSTWPEPIVVELCGFFSQEQISIDGFHTTAPYGVSDAELNADIYDYYPSVNPVQSGTYTLPTPTKEGYTFDGWYTTSDFSGEKITEVSASIKVYAKWVAAN